MAFIKKYALLFLIILLAGFLRTYHFTINPPGLYVDEVSVAYNAYSLLITGKDEHGVAHPFAFQAFGEYKMPVFAYMTVASIALFGKTTFAIRIPSAVFGTLTVLVFYFFAKELIVYEKEFSKKQKEIFTLLSTFLLAVSPWHLQFSRAGFEAIVALCFFLIGALFFLYYYRLQKSWLIFISFFFFVFSMYSYNAFRVLGCIGIVVSLVFFYIQLSKKRKTLLASGIFAFLLALPMIIFSFTAPGQARFQQVNAFAGKANIFVYPLQFLTNYLSYFSLSFLFSFGDTIGRHSVFRMGALFKWEILPLLVGIYFFVKEKINFFKGINFFLLLIAPIAASIAVPSPHLLRSLIMILPLTLLVSFGLVKLWEIAKNKYIIFGLLLIIACFEGILYVDLYYNHAAITVADWGGQYQELLTKLATYENRNTVIVVNNNVGMSYVYEKFYYPSLHIYYVDDSWKKPESMKDKIIIYVTSAEEKQKNTYLHFYPHTLVNTITTPDVYKNSMYNIWKI